MSDEPVLPLGHRAAMHRLALIGLGLSAVAVAGGCDGDGEASADTAPGATPASTTASLGTKANPSTSPAVRPPGSAVRRVVTGHDEFGKAVFVRDDLMSPTMVVLAPGEEWFPLWGADGPAQLPGDGSRPAAPLYYPPVGGYRFMVRTLAPVASTPQSPNLDVDAAVHEVETDLPGLLQYLDEDADGVVTARSPTVDFVVVLNGEAVLELDDGETRVLQPGDTVVQNGTRHRYWALGARPAQIAMLMVGAHHDGIG